MNSDSFHQVNHFDRTTGCYSSPPTQPKRANLPVAKSFASRLCRHNTINRFSPLSRSQAMLRSIHAPMYILILFLERRAALQPPVSITNFTILTCGFALLQIGSISPSSVSIAVTIQVAIAKYFGKRFLPHFNLRCSHTYLALPQ
jgi:hypothetical protein